MNALKSLRILADILKKKIDLFMKIRQGEFLREDVGIWDMISDFRLQMFEMQSVA